MNFPRPSVEIISTEGVDLAKLDSLFLNPTTGRLNLLPADAWRLNAPHIHLRVWLAARARYQVPTIELVDWLKDRIGPRSALEIGAGMGDLGFHLNIQMTDSYQQVDDPMTVAMLTSWGQAPTRPPADVWKEDAENAVRRRKPQVVVGAWVTEKWIPANVPWDTVGNYKGPREDYLLERCDTYIAVGNQAIHGKKRLLSLPHRTFEFPWLVSRAAKQELNRIYVWENPSRV